jgi:hypothetical protein
MVQDLFRGAGFEDAPLVEEEDAVGDVAGEVEVVGDEEEGEAVIGEAAEDIADFLAEFGVEGGGGFVEEENLGFHGEGAGDGDALLLTAGELGGAVVGAVGEADPFEELEGFGFDLGAGATEDVDGGFEDVFEGGAVGEEMELLEDHAGPEPELALLFAGDRTGAIDGDVVDGDESGVGGVEVVETAEEGGFAAAGRADEDDGFRACLVVIDGIEDAMGVEGLGEFADGDHVRRERSMRRARSEADQLMAK